VNADFKKLYDKGRNPEGIKIGPGNIFEILDEVKDKILSEFRYNLQTDGTLKLDHIMDILRLANETVTRSMDVEEKIGKNGLIKINQLKGLIKGLSEKVGLSPSELSETNQKTEKAFDDAKQIKKINDLGEISDEIVGQGDIKDLNEASLAIGKEDEIEENLEAADDLEEDEVLEEIEDVEEVSEQIFEEGELEESLEAIEDFEEDEILEEVEDVEEVLEEIAEEDETDEDLEVIEGLEEDEILEELAEGPEDSEAAGGRYDQQDDGIGHGSGSLKSEDGPDGAGPSEKDAGTRFGSGDTGVGQAAGGDGAGSDSGVGLESLETDDFQELEAVDELEEDEILEEVEDVEEVLEEIAEEDETDEDLEVIEDLEEDEIFEEVEDIEPDDLPGGPEDSEGTGSGEDLKIVKTGQDSSPSGPGDDTDRIGASEKDAGTGFQAGDTGIGHVGVGDEAGLDGGMGLEPLKTDRPPEVVEIDDSQEFEDLDDLEEDEILEEVESVDIDDTVEETTLDGRIGGIDEKFEEDNGEDGIKKSEGAKKTEEIGLPVDSLGQEYSDEVSDKVKKDRLLAEKFDGYLGVMDRYYNHYILIPGGEYIVGAKKPEKDEKPEQLISLSPFYIGRFPVTNGLFQIFVEKTGYKTVAEKIGYGNVYYGRFQRKKDETTGLITSTWNSSLYCETVEGAFWYQPCGPGSTVHNKRNHPVVQISFEDAMAFAAWTGKRLPTENEWEAASRTTKGWILPWGKEWKKHTCNIEESCTGDTTPVEKYAEFENDFGIVDTIGNILEWTVNSFTGRSDNKNKNRYHIAKGGSWISGDDIRSFSRFKITPESHSNILGFRCVAD
jgi:formylglycine-generating enzyme required for sulfatase activity